MPILPFIVIVLFFVIINLFLALFLASIVTILLKLNGVAVETLEMNLLIFACCATLWIGIRIIFLNSYSFENFTTIFIWPMNSILPKDIIQFLNATVNV